MFHSFFMISNMGLAALVLIQPIHWDSFSVSHDSSNLAKLVIFMNELNCIFVRLLWNFWARPFHCLILIFPERKIYTEDELLKCWVRKHQSSTSLQKSIISALKFLHSSINLLSKLFSFLPFFLFFFTSYCSRKNLKCIFFKTCIYSIKGKRHSIRLIAIDILELNLTYSL